MNRLQDLLARVDALTLKERVLVLTAATLVLYASWQALLMDPQSARQRALLASIERQQEEIAALQAQAEAVVRRSQADPDVPNRALRERYTRRLTELDARLAETAADVIAPERVAEVLEGVLRRSGGLLVLEVRGLGAEPLLAESEPAGEGPQLAAGAYRHGVRISFRGGFHDTLAYLEALEALPWKFFWDRIDYRVEDYPRARASIVVYTLSLDARWIGV